MAVYKIKVEEEACTLRFYKIVLGWDYIRLLQESEQRNNKKPGDMRLRKVKDTYKDVDDYISTYEPLLFEEVKAQIVQQKDNGEEEEVTKWKTGIIVECNEADGFHLPLVFGEDWTSIKQNDLLLLSRTQLGEGKEIPTTYAFGLVEHMQLGKIKLRMQLRGEVKGSNANEVKSCPRLLSMQSLVKEVQKTWAIKKICSLSTIVREYVALHSVGTLPFKDIILKAAENNQSSEDRAWKVSRSLMDYMKTNLNEFQVGAIQAGLSRKPFVLIQGPPGTGKTQTILGILSVILHAIPARIHAKDKVTEIKRGPELPLQNKYTHWEKASPWLGGTNPRDAIMPENGDDGFFPTTGNELKPEMVNSSRKYRVRVLVCAPSNSALDEIVMRVTKTGIRDENECAYNPKIVRIGVNPHHDIKSVTMDYLVQQKRAAMAFQSGDKQKHGRAGTDLDALRASVLDEAAIVFSTLSFSGSTLFSKINRNFDVVIIDEAAQAVEAATLVPLSNGCKQVFLVGDPVQLPATVISPVAEKFGYGMSLFKRFQKAGYPIQMLKKQYRMHPEIRSFPSKEFYDEALEDGPDVKARTVRAWHDYSCFGPFCFFDLHEGEESQPSNSGSWENVDEVQFVLLMFHKLIARYPAELKSSSRIAIISPYRSQVELFRKKFKDTFGDDGYKEVVEINTVDGFQGREKDVAIFSCVRASKDKGIGFVADFRRMNVGITRAKSSVLVVGSASALKQDEHWANLIESAEKRSALYKVSKPYAEFFSDKKIETMKVKKEEPEGEKGPGDGMEMDVPMDVNMGDVDQGVADQDWGGGDEGFENEED